MPGLPKLNRLTLREQVLESLRESILTGAFRPGDHLRETELAEGYGVSRGTVREALRTLEQARLVRSDSRGKVRVRTLAPQEIDEIFRVRAALEGQAAAEIINRSEGESAAAELKDVLPPTPDQPMEYLQRLEADLAFHEHLCELSGNTTLLETWKALEGRMRVVMFSPREGDPVDIMGADHHTPLLDALRSGDTKAAREAFSTHMAEAALRWNS